MLKVIKEEIYIDDTEVEYTLNEMEKEYNKRCKLDKEFAEEYPTFKDFYDSNNFMTGGSFVKKEAKEVATATVYEIRKFAMRYYQQGGDTIVECWDDSDIQEVIDKCKKNNKDVYKEFKRIFKGQASWESEERAAEDIFPDGKDMTGTSSYDFNENYSPLFDDTGYEPSYDELLPDLEINEEILAKEEEHLNQLKIMMTNAIRAEREWEVNTLNRKIIDANKRIDYIKELINNVVKEDLSWEDDDISRFWISSITKIGDGKLLANIFDNEKDKYQIVYDIKADKIVATTNFAFIVFPSSVFSDLEKEFRKYALKKEDYEEFDDPEEPEQEFDSAGTSINQVPALFKMNDFIPGNINLDIGGGKYDTATEYLKNTLGSTNLVYDPKNRSPEHNKEVIEMVRANGGADSVTCANVLNVIKEPEVRLAIIRNCYKYLKSGHKAYFITYEDDGKGDEGPTTKGYQLRKKTTFYKNEIEQVFNKVEITNGNKLIIATK